MRTRLRDWFIVGVALAIVFGVSVQAPRDSSGVGRFRPAPPVSDGSNKFTPGVAPPGYRRGPHPANLVPPFPMVDPRPMILYYPPGFSR